MASHAFSEEPKYTVESSEERITYLVDLIEKNLADSSVLIQFREEQQAWETYKEKHLGMLFPESIDNVKMVWGSVMSTEMGNEVLILNLDRIKMLEAYVTRNSETGTDGRGEYKDYVNELRRIQNK